MSSQKRRVFVVGVGMTNFIRPGSVKNRDYHDMVEEAVLACLKDARINYDQVQQANVGYVFGDSACGQKGLYKIGMTGIPIINVNNNCATGSTALYLSKLAIEGGLCDCSLAVGFEKMEKGALEGKYKDREQPLQNFVDLLYELTGSIEPAPLTAQLFYAAAKAHMDRYGTTVEHYAKIAYKNHQHSVNNPYAQFKEALTFEECLNGKKVFGCINRHSCCPISDGAGAAILASEQFVVANNLQDQAIEIAALEMASDTASTFELKCPIKLVGFDMTRKAAQQAYTKAGVRPDQIDVIELHDCFASNELITYEALGLCPVGQAKNLVDANDNTYGGKWVINPSGGLLSKGHPLGATGLAQCCELTWQLRRTAGPRQVSNANLALQHNMGLGGAAVVGIYKRPDKQWEARMPSKL